MAEYAPAYASLPSAACKLLSAPDAKNNPSSPNKPLPLPNITPQPRIQNDNDAMANTIKFFAKMFTVFFTRHKPDSTMAKPKFMKNTKNAVTMTHIVSSPTFTVADMS